jgi:hypothetical protein
MVRRFCIISHPADFTPFVLLELGTVANYYPELLATQCKESRCMNEVMETESNVTFSPSKMLETKD